MEWGKWKKKRMDKRVRRGRIPTYQLISKLEWSLTGNQRWPNTMKAGRLSG
jgi:hypothetical protein